jgi:RNA polymerase sigma-70 factor (ECF subfamily)
LPPASSASDDLGAFYARWAPEVFRFALYLSGRRGDAEDITAETFVRVWTSNAPIRAATVKGYLFTIARNLHLESLRRSSRQIPIDPSLPDPPDPSPDPLARAEQAAEWSAVAAGLRRLSEVDRAAVVMRSMHDLPYEEIARVLGLSVTNARVKVHRARALLAADAKRSRR